MADRAETAQSVVARIEGGLTSPTWETLERLLQAAGKGIRVSVEALAGAAAPESGDIPRVLALDPAARLQEGRNADRFVNAARRVS